MRTTKQAQLKEIIDISEQNYLQPLASSSSTATHNQAPYIYAVLPINKKISFPATDDFGYLDATRKHALSCLEQAADDQVYSQKIWMVNKLDKDEAKKLLQCIPAGAAIIIIIDAHAQLAGVDIKTLYTSHKDRIYGAFFCDSMDSLYEMLADSPAIFRKEQRTLRILDWISQYKRDLATFLVLDQSLEEYLVHDVINDMISDYAEPRYPVTLSEKQAPVEVRRLLYLAVGEALLKPSLSPAMSQKLFGLLMTGLQQKEIDKTITLFQENMLKTLDKQWLLSEEMLELHEIATRCQNLTTGLQGSQKSVSLFGRNSAEQQVIDAVKKITICYQQLAQQTTRWSLLSKILLIQLSLENHINPERSASLKACYHDLHQQLTLLNALLSNANVERDIQAEVMIVKNYFNNKATMVTNKSLVTNKTEKYNAALQSAANLTELRDKLINVLYGIRDMPENAVMAQTLQGVKKALQVLAGRANTDTASSSVDTISPHCSTLEGLATNIKSQFAAFPDSLLIPSAEIAGKIVVLCDQLIKLSKAILEETSQLQHSKRVP